MQTKLYTIQFFSPSDNQFTAPKRFELPAESGFEKTHGNRKPDSLLPPGQTHSETECGVYGMEYFRWPA